METSVSVSGTMRGTQVQEMITFSGTPTTEKGVIHGLGKGVVMRTPAGSGGVCRRWR
jgi:hypothetical protein